MKKLLFLALSCSLWACKDDEVTPPDVQPPQEEKPTATVTVWNALQWSPEHPQGLPAEGATVELFISRQDYLSNKPAYTATTNKDGVAKFDIPEGEYFMVASKDYDSNTWRDAQDMTIVSDTLYQTEAEIFDPMQPKQESVLPGDFKYADLNFDGIINNNDVAEAPFFKITVKKNVQTNTRTLIGSLSNHFYTSVSAIEEAFANELLKISAAHQRMVMLDGILSDEADCQISNLPAGWCDLNNFTFTATNTVIDSVWRTHYTSILHLNRMLESMNGFRGENAALIAQLRAFRAYLYLELHTYFGALPITEQLLLYPSTSRSSVDGTKLFIRKELVAAAAKLSDVQPANKPWYMTTSAVNMLLARMAAMETDGASTISYTEKVIATAKYELADSAKVFTAPIGKEIIWDMTANMTSPFRDYFTRGGLKVDFSPAIRYTETYLLNAMGHIISGNFDDANKSINVIRTRGKKPAITLTTQDELRTELDNLYKEELYREGFRFARLVLYRQAQAVLGSKGYQDHHALMPIPMSAIEAYPNFFQNAGY